MATLFGVSAERIRQDRKQILKELGIALKTYNPQEFVGWYMDQAYYHMLAFKKKGRDDLSWGVASDLARQLTNWGLVVPPDQLQRMANGEMAKKAENPLELLTDEQLAAIEKIVNEEAKTA
jgi:hypothetical protein